MKFFETETYRHNPVPLIGDKLDYLIFFKNEYYPISFLSEGKVNTNAFHLTDGGFVIKNHIPTGGVTPIQGHTGKYPNFLRDFKYYGDIHQYVYKIKGVEHFVLFRKGEIYSPKGEILLTMTTNNVKSYVKYRIMNPKFLKLYISVEFQTNPIYAALYKKLKVDFIDKMMEAEVDIVVAKSQKIFDELYRRSFKFSFDNINDLGQMFDGSIENFYNTFNADNYKDEFLAQNPQVQVRIIEREVEIEVEKPIKKRKQLNSMSYEAESFGTVIASGTGSGTYDSTFVPMDSGGAIHHGDSIRIVDSSLGTATTISMQSGILDLNGSFNDPVTEEQGEENDLSF